MYLGRHAAWDTFTHDMQRKGASQAPSQLCQGCHTLPSRCKLASERQAGNRLQLFLRDVSWCRHSRVSSSAKPLSSPALGTFQACRMQDSNGSQYIQQGTASSGAGKPLQQIIYKAKDSLERAKVLLVLIVMDPRFSDAIVVISWVYPVNNTSVHGA